MQKSKKLSLFFSRIILLTGVLTLLLLAAPKNTSALVVGDGGGGTAPATTAKPDICHPENNTPPGEPLSADQLKSCQACKTANTSGCLTGNPIVKDLQTIVDVLSAGVGIIVVAMIIIGGIQYSIAGDNPQKLTDAKKRITNALLALLAFIFLFAFVQWLIPGGIFS